MANIDPLKNGFLISSYWGPRPETPAQIAARYQALLDRLAAISPKFSGWTFIGRKPYSRAIQAGPPGVRYRRGSYTVAADQLSLAALERLVAAGIHRDDDGVPDPEFGFRLSAFTRSRTHPDGLSLSVQAGCWTRLPFFTNTVHIETRPLCDENKTWLTLPLLKAAMLAVCDAWEVTWAAIYPAELIDLWTPRHTKPRPTFNFAWVTYLSPRFAPMVTPPGSAIVDHTPQGGIVMTATRERFDVANPAHLAAAREIENAIAPVNALAWPPDATSG